MAQHDARKGQMRGALTHTRTPATEGGVGADRRNAKGDDAKADRGCRNKEKKKKERKTRKKKPAP